MTSIFLAIVLGIIFTIVALQNPGMVGINLFGNFYFVPLYLLTATTFLLGAFIAAMFDIFDMIMTAFDLRKKENTIREVAKTNRDLQNSILIINEENTRLRDELSQVRADLRSTRFNHWKEGARNFFERLRHGFA